MITSIQSERLIVISDLHVGNPFSSTRRKTMEFLRWVADNNYDLCINGDGFEVAQVSREKIAAEVPDVLLALKQAAEKGVRIYYVVGNHDIFFEYFLHDWGGVKLAPFLNVKSGEKRIRVEHGHLYDPFFVRYPRLYEACTWIGGLFLKLAPSLYRAWIRFEKLKSRFRSFATKNKDEAAIEGEHPNFRAAALNLERRGFDAVIFGHTHHAGSAKLELGGIYFNSGSWMLGESYLEVSRGEVRLKKFAPASPKRAEIKQAA